MYGYLRPGAARTSTVVRNRYRRYYCSLCHALRNNYGSLARLTVSYDMTFAAVVLSSRFQLPAGKIRCMKRVQLPDPAASWKKLAALTVILAAGKLDDDIADDRSVPARLGRLFLGRAIRKAARDYPEAYRAVREQMACFTRLEAEKQEVRVLSACFSGVIARGVRALFPDLNPKEEAILRYVTEWVYFIDAVDDLDEDRRKKKPNPFLQLAASREELLIRHADFIRGFADERVEKLRAALHGEDFSSAEDLIVAAVVNGTIPETTCRVFSLIPGYPRAGTGRTRKRGKVLYG